MLKRFAFFVFSTLYATVAMAGGGHDEQYTRKEYITIWDEVAVDEMNKYGIPASITLAQGILESRNGNSRLALEANNHFGIKCHDWSGNRVYEDDDERDECFRKYSTAGESYEDHSRFLANRSRYAFLFDLSITDYKGWAKGLKEAGYATNPKYPKLLIRIIEENELARYDQRYSGKPLAASNAGSRTREVDARARLLENRSYYISDNRIKFVEIKHGDTYSTIEQVYHVDRRQVIRYNDLEKDHRLQAGEKLYIQPKRNHARRFDSHVVEKDETLWDISQRYGVRMRKILKHNNLSSRAEIEPGMRLMLN